MKNLKNSRRTARLAGFGAIALAAVVAVIVLTGGPSHSLKIAVPASTNIVKGVPLNAGGESIGSINNITPLDGGRAAMLEVNITNDRFWPLPKDSTISMRQGGTISSFNRYLLVDKGTSDDTYANGDTIPMGQVKTPVELDQLINAIDAPVRQSMKDFYDEGGENMKQLAEPLQDTLPKIQPVTQNTADVLSQVVSDQETLSSLVISADRVTKSINAADPDLRALLTNAATTFDAIGDRSTQLQTTLQRLPAAMDSVQNFLVKANPAVDNVDRAAQALKPAIQPIRTTAPLLTGALQGLARGLPLGTEALKHTRGVYRVSDTFIKLANLSPRLESTFTKANTTLNCLRPYTPEIAALGMIWGDFISMVDDKDHVVRAQVQNFLPAPANLVPYSPQQAEDTFGVEYGFPRPPGYNADQNWFQPKCGAGPDAIDPSKDKEFQAFQKNQQKTGLAGDQQPEGPQG